MKLEECDAEEWDDFLVASPESTLFAESTFLRSYGRKLKFLVCKDGNEPLAGLPLFDDVLRESEATTFQQYNGLHFSEFAGLKAGKRVQKRFEAVTAFAEHLATAYDRLRFIHHWNVKDLRPFAWFNFQRQTGVPHFDTGVTYTALLDLSGENPEEAYRKGRKSDLTAARRLGLVTRAEDDEEVLWKLHRLTFERQNVDLGDRKSGYVPAICRNLLKAGKARLFVTRQGDTPASACLIGFDRFRAYYVFGASDPAFRDGGSGTANLHEAIVAMKRELGIRELDLVGVNSPQRGSFKLSFGAAVVPHLTTTLVKGP